MATKKQKKIKKAVNKIVKAVIRKYRGSDSYLMEQSQTLQALFALDKADFIAMVTALDDPFAANWLAAINAAVNYTDDFVILGQIMPKTVSVLEAMENAKKRYREIIFYAEQHFGRNSKVLREFGKGKDYEKASRSQEKMFEFMDELFDTATKYHTELEAKGCDPLSIAAIAADRDALRTSNVSQNIARKGRPVISEGRTIVYNTLYDFTRKVVDASKRVYADNATKLEEYSYRPPVNHKKAIRKGSLEPNAIAYIDLEDVDVELTDTMTLQAKGADMFLYAAATVGAAPASGTPGITVQKDHQYSSSAEEAATAVQQDDTKPYIHIQNKGTGTGTFKLTID